MRALLSGYGWSIVVGLLVAIIVLQYQQQQRASGDAGTAGAPITSFAPAVERALPSVVNIDTQRLVAERTHPLLNDPLFRRFINPNALQQRSRVQESLGSGVIVSEDGYILTNHHVIDGASQITVQLIDGRQREAQLVGSDEPSDLAVLKIEAQGLSAIEFGDPESTRIGDLVLAIGNPYNIGQTVTQGIVSATGRHLRRNTYENYIQTDAAINAGNSGGALVNVAGQLVGINSGLISRAGGSTGIGFAIPVDTARYVMDNIVEYGEVLRGWLGVTADAISPTIAEEVGLPVREGLLLVDIAEGGPAALGGLQVGDILTHIDNESVGNAMSGMYQIAQTRPGTPVNLRILRAGASQSLIVTVGKQPRANRSAP